MKGTKTHGHDFFNGITMAFSLFVRRNGTSHANAMNFVQKKWKYREKCPYKKPSFFLQGHLQQLTNVLS